MSSYCELVFDTGIWKYDTCNLMEFFCRGDLKEEKLLVKIRVINNFVDFMNMDGSGFIP